MPAALPTSIRLLALMIALVAPAAAAAEGVLDTLFPLGGGTCWGRSYDAAHLAEHPAQKVRTLHLWDHWGKNGLFETPDDIDYADPAAQGRDLRRPLLLVERVDRPGVWERRIDCSAEADRAGCIIDEDDGKHFPLTLTPKGGAVLAEIAEPGLDLIRAPDVARLGRSPEEMHLGPGADDRLFRLERRPIGECRDRLLAAAPDYARDGRPPLRAIVAQALGRTTAGPGTPFRAERGRTCLKAGGGGPRVIAGFNPALGDFMTGVDHFRFVVSRGEGGAATRYLFDCDARAWEWRCSGGVAGPDGSRLGEEYPAHLLRRRGGATLVVASSLWSGAGDGDALDPPIALEVVETGLCPPAIWTE